MTPFGNIRLSQQGGLRVTIEDVEHLITAPDVAYLNGPPRYARGTTDGGENLANGLTGGSECA